MIFPFFTTACDPGILAYPDVSQRVPGDTESHPVWKSVSPACMVRRSTTMPSPIFGVSIVSTTGFENRRCIPESPNSNPSTCASACHFLRVPRFFIFFSYFTFAFCFFAKSSELICIKEESITSPLSVEIVVPDSIATEILP